MTAAPLNRNVSEERDAKRYRVLKRQALSHIDSADDYGYEAERFDKYFDELAEWYRKFDANELGPKPE